MRTKTVFHYKLNDSIIDLYEKERWRYYLETDWEQSMDRWAGPMTAPCKVVLFKTLEDAQEYLENMIEVEKTIFDPYTQKYFTIEPKDLKTVYENELRVIALRDKEREKEEAARRKRQDNLERHASEMGLDVDDYKRYQNLKRQITRYTNQMEDLQAEIDRINAERTKLQFELVKYGKNFPTTAGGRR